MPRSGKSALWKTSRRLLHHMRLESHRFRWYGSNRHNETFAVNQFRRDHVEVGNFTYGPLRVIDGAASSRLRIGSFCSIAEDVTFVLNGDHPLDRISTFPLRAFVLGEQETVQSRGDIVLGDDVWIGHGAVILSGVTLGRGSVIAAGSIVTRDVADYAIVAGSPARVVRSRFGADVLEAVRKVDMSRLNEPFIRRNLEMLEASVDAASVDEILRALGSRADGTT